MFEPSLSKLLLTLILFLGIPVGAWYFIRSAVASGVRAAHRRDDGPPPADQPGSDPD
jgi:hypothetical protein